MDYLSHLATDYQRLAEVSAGHLADRVPTCPDWTVDDLVRHVAVVYLHKVECMRLNASPDPWPPDLSAEPALDLLARAYGSLAGELGTRGPDTPAATWYGPDQTVGFWRRRMAQETVIHRIDAELAAGAPTQSIPDELAIDGIDEILAIFLAWACEQWPEDFAEPLSKGDGAVLVSADSASWLVSWDSGGVQVTRAHTATAPIAAEPEQGGLSAAAQAVVSGTPESVLRWLWRRAGDEVIEVSGEASKVAQMRALMEPATQ
jgi:uncharacterized protein (TIGR03083 family)